MAIEDWTKNLTPESQETVAMVRQLGNAGVSGMSLIRALPQKVKANVASALIEMINKLDAADKRNGEVAAKAPPTQKS